jgi:hypothetical protein
VQAAPDPIFEAIDAYRIAAATVMQSLHDRADIEESLPPERKRWRWSYGGPDCPPPDCTE